MYEVLKLMPQVKCLIETQRNLGRFEAFVLHYQPRVNEESWTIYAKMSSWLQGQITMSGNECC